MGGDQESCHLAGFIISEHFKGINSRTQHRHDRNKQHTCELISMCFMSSINTEKDQLTRDEKQGEGFQVEFE